MNLQVVLSFLNRNSHVFMIIDQSISGKKPRNIWLESRFLLEMSVNICYIKQNRPHFISAPYKIAPTLIKIVPTLFSYK